MSDQCPRQVARRTNEGASTGRVFACRLHNPSSACCPRSAEQTRPLRSAAPHQRGHATGDSGRPTTSRSKDRFPKRSPYTGPKLEPEPSFIMPGIIILLIFNEQLRLVFGATPLQDEL